jgi:hypothetical protein
VLTQDYPPGYINPLALFANIKSLNMNTVENLERFVQERMLSCCREVGLSFGERVTQVGLTAEDRVALADMWLD